MNLSRIRVAVILGALAASTVSVAQAESLSDPDEFVGGYAARFEEIERLAKRTEPCDEEDRKRRIAVVDALESWSDRTRFEFDDGWIRIGPMRLRERTREETTVSWEEEPYDWDAAYALWTKLAKAEDSDPRWVRLRKRVVRLLNSDYQRRVDEKDLSLEYRHLDAGPELRSSLAACRDTEIDAGECASFEGSPATRYLRRENASFAFLYRDWKEANSIDARRAAFGELESFALFLDTYFLPRKTSGVRWRDGRLEVSMRAGDFAGAEGALAAIIESFWNRVEDSLRIRWADPEDRAHFVFRFLDRPGEPSSVNRSKRIVRLADEARESTPAHEFGHVLGFRDRYFKVWLPHRCGYVYQFRSGDLMGEVSAGRILPDHWRALKAVYP